MIWDSTVKFTDVAIVCATLLGPVLAVQAQKYLERRRSVDERRHAIFRALMATRATRLSSQYVEALNAVPVEFYGKDPRLTQINESWKLYLDHHDQQRIQAGDAWVMKHEDLFLDLLHKISRFLGYSFSLTQLRSDVYLPQAHTDLEVDQAVIRKGLVSLFNGESALPLAVKELPDSNQTHHPTA